MGKPNVTLDVVLLITKEITYRGSFRYGVCGGYLQVYCALLIHNRSPATQPGDYSVAIALVSQGNIDLKSLVTHRHDPPAFVFGCPKLC